MSTVHFREDDSTTVEKNSEGKFMQVGRGLILWSHGSPIHLYRDGVELGLAVLNGCFIAETTGAACWQICGTDDEGRGRFIPLSDHLVYDGLRLPSKQQVVQLLTGRPFREVLAEMRRLAIEADMARLKQKAEIGKKALEALSKIREINERGGQGSRTAVRTIIDGVFSE